MTFLKLGLASALALGLAACSNTTDTAAVDPNAAGGTISETSLQYFNTVVGDRVFFDTDSSALDLTAQETLTRQAQWMQANASTTAVIEGHADERGTREYNIALGARRANAAYNFLVSQGIDGSRLRTVSYGKERPEALGSDDASWAQNRRSVSVVTGAPVS